MKFLHHNKKMLNNIPFSKSDYFVLSYEQLLKVNGAGSSPNTPSTSGPTSGYGTCAGGGAVTSSSNNNNPTSSYGQCGGGTSLYPPTPTLQKIQNSINENWNKQYNYDTGYMCDNWVEEVLNDAGKDTSKYLKAGKASAKTVQQHIDALVANGKEGIDYTKTLPTEDGAYVVFMDDGKNKEGKDVMEHCAIIIVENGQATAYHNSSGNGGNPVYKTDSEGNILTNKDGNPIVSYYDQGVKGEQVTSKNNGAALKDWLYSTYYYQKIQ